MASNLEPDNTYMAVTSTLASAAVIEFNVVDTTTTDTPETNPVAFWLAVSPSSTEVAPD